MAQTKPPMTLSDHIRLSARVRIAEAAIRSAYIDILQHHVRKDSRELRKLDNILNAMDELRSTMDDIVCVENPDGVGDACVQVYYGSDCGIVDELASICDSYAVRKAMHLLDDNSGRVMDADEIVLTRFDSSKAKYMDEERDGDKFLHVKRSVGYPTADVTRPPEDEINPSKTEYILVPCQIRDFCADAMRSWTYPTDEDIDRVVGAYRVRGELDA